MRGRLILICLTCFFVSDLLAQEPAPISPTVPLAPKYSNEFLKIGIGARAFGMGNSQVAIANDVTAGYWNPAGMVANPDLRYPEVSLMHASYFAGVANYNYAGFTMPVDSAGRRRFGATLIRMGIDDIPNTLNLIRPDGSIDYTEVTSFAVTNLAALFSYAWQPEGIKGLSLGTNVKIIYRGAGRFTNSWGFGLDVGARYQRGGFQAGLVVLDATNTYNAWTFNTETFEEDFIRTGQEIPRYSVELTRPSVRFGLAYDFKLGRRVGLLVSVDNDIFFDGNRSGSLVKGGGVSLDPHGGIEFSYMNSQYRKVAFLRGGMYNIQNITNNDGEATTGVFPTIGAGIVLRNFQIDYALANIGNTTNNLHSHVVSIKFHIQ